MQLKASSHKGVQRIIHEPTGTDHRGALLSRSHAMVVAQGRASLRTMSSRMCRGQI
jgi:hypothetical protein